MTCEQCQKLLTGPLEVKARILVFCSKLCAAKWVMDLPLDDPVWDGFGRDWPEMMKEPVRG